MDAKLNPDQAARIAGIAGWEYDDFPATSFVAEYVRGGTVMVEERQNRWHVTPYGFFDLLRVCEEQGIIYEISHMIQLRYRNKDFLLYIKEYADLPTALALAILKALEDK